jgi:hypothetical protein
VTSRGSGTINRGRRSIGAGVGVGSKVPAAVVAGV